MTHLTKSELELLLPQIEAAPKAQGSLHAIVIRTAPKTRTSLPSAILSPEAGIEGDHWLHTSWLRLPDGSPDPEVQLSLMNYALLAAIAGTEDRIQNAGDNLIVNFDLSQKNLSVGQQLQIGTAILEITATPHLGCRQFAGHYGYDALNFVNSDTGKRLRLRGVYAKVVSAGTISVHDLVKKI